MSAFKSPYVRYCLILYRIGCSDNESVTVVLDCDQQREEEMSVEKGCTSHIKKMIHIQNSIPICQSAVPGASRWQAEELPTHEAAAAVANREIPSK